MIDFEVHTLLPLCAAFGLELSDEQCRQLNRFGNLVLETNASVNLTAITEPKEVLYKHFFDSLLFFKAVRVPAGAALIDVGSGAGFPGMVLKIARPDLQITLLDSLRKRVVFLNDAISALGLSGISALHGRAEDTGRTPAFRERFDFACARAVAALPVLAEYCLPFVKPGGVFVAMKGPAAEAELASAGNALRVLGAGVAALSREHLPDGGVRCLITAEKISQTPPKYPRSSAKIAKQPL